MNSPQKIELFTLKCAVLTREIRTTFNELNITHRRSDLERQTDTLISDYMSQIDFGTVRDAERMSEFYKVFFAL